MIGQLVLLGTGASAGVPLIGCTCSVCTSSSPFNQHLRQAAWLRVNGRSILIDAGPDFRQQALRYNIDHLDGLLITHTHFDHIGGVDDLRIYFVRQKKPMPCLLSQESFEDLKKRFYYFFNTEKKSITMEFEYQVLEEEEGSASFLDLDIRYFSYRQGDMKVTGFRFGDLAYVSDIRNYPESIFASLKGVKTLILSALARESLKLHLSLDEAVSFAKKVGARHTWITHVSHLLEYEETNRSLPPEVQMAYDGQMIEFEI